MRDKKDQRMTIRMTQKQKKMIQEKATKMGLSISSYMVNCAIQKRVDGYNKKQDFKDFTKDDNDDLFERLW